MSHSELSQQMLAWKDRAGSTSGVSAHTAGRPKSAGERHRLVDGGAHLVRHSMLTP
jgi:hypothetical protein